MNLKAAKALWSYLEEKDITTSFKLLEPYELAKILESFYLDARTQSELDKKSSLEGLWHWINRHLWLPPYSKELGIINDSLFRKANNNFCSALEELKQEGKGDTYHFPAISSKDLEKLYWSKEFDSSYPRGLFNKVQFDIRYFFCRHGQENIRSLHV